MFFVIQKAKSLFRIMKLGVVIIIIAVAIYLVIPGMSMMLEDIIKTMPDNQQTRKPFYECRENPPNLLDGFASFLQDSYSK